MAKKNKKKDKKKKNGGSKKRGASLKKMPQHAGVNDNGPPKHGKTDGHGEHAKSHKVDPEARKQDAYKQDTQKTISPAANGIQLAEKIHLEKSTHSYRSYFHRRYGKYFKKVEKPVRIVFKVSVVVFGCIFIPLATLFLVFGRDLPDVSKLKTMNFFETTRIYDREGNLLYSIFGEENRKYVPLNYITPLAVDATLSIEDKNFYNHLGFDPMGMLRAQMKNMEEDSIAQGASTITQQLAKNIFLSPERTYDRKIKELLLALQIEWLYSKDEILEMYLNKIAYGSNAFGIEAAADTFFGKTARDLNLTESAVLAALPKAPSYFSPYGQNKKELIGYCGTGPQLPQTMELVDEMAAYTQEEMAEQTDGIKGSNATEVAQNKPAVAPAVPAKPVQASSLKIAAKNTVWVQVTADGKTSQFTLKPKEEKLITFSVTAKLYLGNTEADISINGKPLTNLAARKLLSYAAKDFGAAGVAVAPAVAAPSATAPAPNIAPAIPTEQTNQELLAADVASKPACSSMYDPNYVWGRKDLVLQRMVEDRYITKAEMEAAWKDGLTLKFRDPVHKIEAPHFVFYVKELLEQKYGKELVENGGLEVKTSLDPNMQSIAEEAVATHSGDNLRRYGANNAALVAIDPKTGQVLTMVGSVDYWNSEIDGQVNVAASPRQPGSSFKPLVYAAAMMKSGMGSGTILSDYKTVFNKKDIPHNADNTYKGRMTIRTALSNSRNIPSIKAYYLAGEEEELLNMLDKLGLTALRKFRDDFNKDAATRGWTFFYGWPMAIGSGEVRLVDLASAYGALANEGKYLPLNPILEVRDRKGNILEKFQASPGTQVIDPQVAYVISNILSDVLAKPAGSWRNSMTIPGYTVASKTGTSNKKVGRGIYPNNNIMIGYTPNIVAAVWVGNTDGSRMLGNAWAFADAGPMWQQFLTAVLKDKPDTPFPQPEGLKWIGKEVYPSFADFKTNFDKRFKKVDTQETGETGQTSDASLPPGAMPDSSWLTGSSAPTGSSATPATTTATNTTANPGTTKPINGEAPSSTPVADPGPGF